MNFRHFNRMVIGNDNAMCNITSMSYSGKNMLVWLLCSLIWTRQSGLIILSYAQGLEGSRGGLIWLVRWRRRQRRRCRSWCSITRPLYSISTLTVLSPATAGMGNDTFWGFHNDLCSPWIHHCLLSFLASAIHKSAIHNFSNSPIWINIEWYGHGCYSKQ